MLSLATLPYRFTPSSSFSSSVVLPRKAWISAPISFKASCSVRVGSRSRASLTSVCTSSSILTARSRSSCSCPCVRHVTALSTPATIMSSTITVRARRWRVLCWSCRLLSSPHSITPIPKMSPITANLRANSNMVLVPRSAFHSSSTHPPHAQMWGRSVVRRPLVEGVERSRDVFGVLQVPLSDGVDEPFVQSVHRLAHCAGNRCEGDHSPTSQAPIHSYAY